MNTNKRIVNHICFVLVVSCVLWLVVSTRDRPKTPKSSSVATPPSYQGPETHRAAAQGKLEEIKLKLDQDSSLITSLDSKGNTPLNSACRYRPKKKGGVIDLLHKHGAVRRHGKNNSYDYEPDLIGFF